MGSFTGPEQYGLPDGWETLAPEVVSARWECTRPAITEAWRSAAAQWEEYEKVSSKTLTRLTDLMPPPNFAEYVNAATRWLWDMQLTAYTNQVACATVLTLVEETGSALIPLHAILANLDQHRLSDGSEPHSDVYRRSPEYVKCTAHNRKVLHRYIDEMARIRLLTSGVPQPLTAYRDGTID